MEPSVDSFNDEAKHALALALFALLLWLGLRLRTLSLSAEVGAPASTRPLPRLWTLRFAAFLGAFLVLAHLFILRLVIPIPLLTIGIVAGITLLGIVLVGAGPGVRPVARSSA